ncbi:hypothetical protein [Haploplasma modicum]|jgi:heme O synthase-like polyprenyltransferase|uniref:hypothetical protein n=1 Tax=Haploplasma modicum TaxID=2150 RepID=UPI00138ADEFF|nr:hypothetical protein [Haploplasma modicum]
MKKNKRVTLWGEYISIKDFLLSLLISLSILLIVILMPALNKDLKLILGLSAVVIGFIINTIWIKPKRNVKVVKGERK